MALTNLMRLASSNVVLVNTTDRPLSGTTITLIYRYMVVADECLQHTELKSKEVMRVTEIAVNFQK